MNACAKRQPGQQRQAGLSLIELMVAITLGLIILAALVGVFATTGRSFHQNDATAQLQDNARAALDALGRDLAMAGYWGGVADGSLIDSKSVAAGRIPNNECGTAANWTYLTAQRIEFFDGNTSGNTPAKAVAQFPCLNNVLANTDIVAIRRVAGQSTYEMTPSQTSAQLHTGFVYLQTNGTNPTMIIANTGTPGAIAPYSPTPAVPQAFYRYVPRIYYVRDYNRTMGDGTPALCRAEFCPAGWAAGSDGTLGTATCGSGSGTAAGYYAQCLASGVESLQINWGVNWNLKSGVSGTPNCTVDTYRYNWDNASLSGYAMTAQVSLLLRTTQPDPGYIDTKTYNLPNAGYLSPDPNFLNTHRRIFSTTVQMRNPVGATGLCS